MLHEPGAAAAAVGQHAGGGRGLWGAALLDEMESYNHSVGLKIVGECCRRSATGVTLADETDQYGLRIPRITYSWCDNDKR